MKTLHSIYDSIVIGGGPAGLSAAIYLARFNRSVLVIDSKTGGRWATHEINQNYFGFPKGISARSLRNRGKRQAKEFGTKFKSDTIKGITRRNNEFIIIGQSKQYRARTVIIATGVTDNFPALRLLDSCLGKSIFWCITCDGYRTINKRILVAGDTEKAKEDAMQFLNFTDKVSLVIPKKNFLDEEESVLFRRKGVVIYFGTITEAEGKEGYISTISLSSGKKISTDFLFFIKEATPNTTLLKHLGVKTDNLGYIITDIEQRTNIQGLYAAGDVTSMNAQQIAAAVHEGAAAAQAANYELYKPFQK